MRILQGYATDAPDMNSCIPDENKDIFEMAICDGLSALEYCFAFTTLATKYYTATASNGSTIMLQFMKQGNQQQLFVKAVCEVIRASDMLQCLLTANCANQHFDCEAILKGVFNFFVKNELKRLNTHPVEGELALKVMRTVRKLTSKGRTYFSKNLCAMKFWCYLRVIVSFSVLSIQGI